MVYDAGRFGVVVGTSSHDDFKDLRSLNAQMWPRDAPFNCVGKSLTGMASTEVFSDRQNPAI
jgi:hypothetical protein